MPVEHLITRLGETAGDGNSHDGSSSKRSSDASIGSAASVSGSMSAGAVQRTVPQRKTPSAWGDGASEIVPGPRNANANNAGSAGAGGTGQIRRLSGRPTSSSSSTSALPTPTRLPEDPHEAMIDQLLRGGGGSGGSNKAMAKKGDGSPKREAQEKAHMDGLMDLNQRLREQLDALEEHKATGTPAEAAKFTTTLLEKEATKLSSSSSASSSASSSISGAKGRGGADAGGSGSGGSSGAAGGWAAGVSAAIAVRASATIVDSTPVSSRGAAMAAAASLPTTAAASSSGNRTTTATTSISSAASAVAKGKAAAVAQPGNSTCSSSGSATTTSSYAGRAASKRIEMRRVVLKNYDPGMMSPYDDVSEELSVAKNDILTTFGGPGGDGYYVALHKGRKGLVPAAVLSTAPAAAATAARAAERQKPRVQSLYAYAARTARELTFKKADVFLLLDDSVADWVKVKSMSGKVGYVPRNYVYRIPDDADGDDDDDDDDDDDGDDDDEGGGHFV